MRQLQVMSKVVIKEINHKPLFYSHELHSAYIFAHMSILKDSEYKSVKVKRNWNFDGHKISEMFVKTFRLYENYIVYSFVIIHDRGY